MKTKKLLSLFLSLLMLLCAAACGGSRTGQSDTPDEPAGEVELVVFAAASLTETVDAIIEAYKEVAPNVTVVPNYDSSGTLLTQIRSGADCDLFLSAAQKQMNVLEEEGYLLEGTRLDLLENKVVLVVPEGNPKGVESFDGLVELLRNGGVFLAMGNSDVPVGQYTQKIFEFYGLDEEALAAGGLLTYGSNVKEVVTHVSESMADCGVVYATDAASAGLTVVDFATAEMCGQVIYPAAVLESAADGDAAQDFLAYLQSEEAQAIFASVGFSPAF